MGEGGINPEYFLYRMKWWEVQHFINGYNRRKRNEWMTTRHLEYMIVRLFGNKNDANYPDTPEDLYPFSWENTDDQVSEDDIVSAYELIRQENEKNNGNNHSLLCDSRGTQGDDSSD